MRSGDIHGMTGAREARDGTTADILARCLRNVHACTSERVNIHVMKPWVSLSGQNLRVGRCIVLHDVELDLRPLANRIEFKTPRPAHLAAF